MLRHGRAKVLVEALKGLCGIRAVGSGRPGGEGGNRLPEGILKIRRSIVGADRKDERGKGRRCDVLSQAVSAETAAVYPIAAPKHNLVQVRKLPGETETRFPCVLRQSLDPSFIVESRYTGRGRARIVGWDDIAVQRAARGRVRVQQREIDSGIDAASFAEISEMFEAEAGIQRQPRSYFEVILHVSGCVIVAVITGEVAGNHLIQIFVAVGQARGGGAVVIGVQAEQEIGEGQEIDAAEILQVGGVHLIARVITPEAKAVVAVSPG